MLLHTLLAVAPLLHSDPRVTTEQIEPLRAVPRDAFVVLSCAPLDAMRADAARNAWSQFFHDESMSGAWKKLEGLHEKVAKHEPNLDPKKFFESIHGRIAGFARAGDEGALQFGFVIEPGAQHADFDAALAGLIGRVGAELERTTANRAGVELAFYAKPETSTAPANSKRHHDPDQFATFTVGGFTVCLCGTDRENLVELANGMVDRIHGSDPSGGLDSSAALAAARKNAGSNGRIECFVDLATVMSKFVHKSKDDAKSQKLLDALGVNELRWAYASGDFGAGEDLDLSIDVKLPEKGAIADWIQCLKPYNAPFALALPRDSERISLANIDLYGLWKSVWTTMSELEPTKTKQARASLDAETKMLGGVDLEKDVISQITGDFATFDVTVPAGEWKTSAMLPSEIGDAKTKEKLDSIGGTVGSAFLIGLRDSSAVEALVEKLLAMAGMSEKLDSEEVAGTEVHFVEMPMGKISWCFVGQGACISVYPTAMKALLEHLAAKTSPSVLDNARFQPVLAKHKDASIVSVCGTPETLKMLGHSMDAMHALGATLHGAEGNDEDSDDEGFDAIQGFTWPSAAVIDRYFKGTMVSTVRLKDGALRVNFSTR